MSLIQRRCRRRVALGEPAPGFSLVELLIVIGLIALLIAILMPMLQKARQQALLASCLANQHQLGRATYTYALDHKGWLPRDGMSGYKLGFFAPYLAVVCGYDPPESMERVNSDVVYAQDYLRPVQILKCPAVPDAPHVLHFVVNSMDFQYFFNRRSYAELGGSRAWAFGPITQVKSPESTGYIFEANMTTLAFDSLGSYNVWRPADLPFYTPPDARAPAPILSGNRMISSIDKRHHGRTTVVFFDGHAEARRLEPGEFPVTILNPYGP